MIALLITLMPGLAWSHPGHLAEVAGHDHILAGVAIGVAIGVAVWGALKGKRDDDAEEDAEETVGDGELQDA
jgi:hypothetical protein